MLAAEARGGTPVRGGGAAHLLRTEEFVAAAVSQVARKIGRFDAATGRGQAVRSNPVPGYQTFDL